MGQRPFTRIPRPRLPPLEYCMSWLNPHGPPCGCWSQQGHATPCSTSTPLDIRKDPVRELQLSIQHHHQNQSSSLCSPPPVSEPQATWQTGCGRWSWGNPPSDATPLVCGHTSLSLELQELSSFFNQKCPLAWTRRRKSMMPPCQSQSSLQHLLLYGLCSCNWGHDLIRMDEDWDHKLMRGLPTFVTFNYLFFILLFLHSFSFLVLVSALLFLC